MSRVSPLTSILLPPLIDELELALQMRKSDQKNGIHFYSMSPPCMYVLSFSRARVCFVEWWFCPAGGPHAFHRAEFLDCLAGNLDPDITSVYFRKRLQSYATTSEASPSSITLEFKDGSTATCDLLIGADGIHSATRCTLLELAAQESEVGASRGGVETDIRLREMKEPVWSGHTAYRTIVSSEKLRNLNPNHRILSSFQLVSSHDCSCGSYDSY